MLIRFAFWMMLLCLPLFLLAKALLIFTFLVIAGFMMQGAALLLLAGFGLLIFAGLIFSFKNMWRVIRDYFSAEQRGKRRLLFMENQHTNRKRLFHFQRIQLNYFSERQRKKLLEKNNQQHINAFSDAIERDLQRIKSQISDDYFSQLQAENRRYRVQQNESGLLKLHHEISKFDGK